MARYLWAKIRVDMRHHPKLIGRPDSDFRLWASLILHAKDHCPDGVVRGMSAADMRGAWGIKAPVENVRKGIAYFEKVEMLIRQPDDGLLIKDFIEEQRPQKDSPEAALERKRRQRERERGVTGDVTGQSNRDPPVTAGRDKASSTRDETRDRSVPCHADLDQEKDLNPDLRGEPVARAGTLWPTDPLTELRTACGKTDADLDWQAFVGRTLRQPVEKRVAGAREFLDGGYLQRANDPLSYCAAMIERSTGKPRGVPTGNGHGRYDDPGPVIPNAQETEKRLAEERKRKTVPMPADLKARLKL